MEDAMRILNRSSLWGSIAQETVWVGEEQIPGRGDIRCLVGKEELRA